MKPHTSTACPCHPDCQVIVKYANGYCSNKPMRAGGLRWNRRGEPFDIASFEVVDGPQEEAA